MDGGLSRTPQPTDRRVVNRSEPSGYRPVQEPPRAPAPVEPKPAQARRSVEPRAPKRKASKKVWVIALIVGAVIVAGFVTWLIIFSSRTATAGIDASKYQTVYLMNGQIYLGKLTAINDTQYRLTNVYYLQTSAAETPEGEETGAEPGSNSQLIKLSDAIYGPEDEMIISKDQVLYFQNLNSGGRGAQLIENDN